MGYIKDYIEWRGDLDFKEDKVNEIDLVALSQIVLLDFSSLVDDVNTNVITLKELMKRYNNPINNKPKNVGLLVPIEFVGSLTKLSSCDRYKNLIVRNYRRIVDYDRVIQYASITLTYEEKYTFIIYSGTDDSTIGWKENFDAMYEDYSDASSEGTEYLNSEALKYRGKLYVFGHSKGGNIALISTLKCSEEVYKRIERTYSFDGQGIPNIDNLTIEEETRFKNVYKILPDCSIIGRIFNHLGKEKIVRSSNKGVYQHDVASWELMGRKFNYVSKFSKTSDEIKELIDNTLLSLSIDDRKKLVSTIYGLAEKENVRTLYEAKLKLSSLILDFFKLERSDRRLVNSLVSILMKDKTFRTCYFDGIYTGIKEDMRKTKYLKKIEKEENKDAK